MGGDDVRPHVERSRFTDERFARPGFHRGDCRLRRTEPQPAANEEAKGINDGVRRRIVQVRAYWLFGDATNNRFGTRSAAAPAAIAPGAHRRAARPWHQRRTLGNKGITKVRLPGDQGWTGLVQVERRE